MGMLAHRCACVQGSTYLRKQDTLLALLINAEFFITHFVVFPAQQVATNTGLFGGSNALWASGVLSTGRSSSRRGSSLSR